MSSKQIILVALVVLAAMGLGRFPQAWSGLVLSLFLGGLLEAVFLWRQKQRLLLPDSGLITALIVALVLSPGAAFWLPPIITAVALLGKHLGKIFLPALAGRPLFNPAATGLVLAAFLPGVQFGWWGETLPWLTLGLGALVVWRVGRISQVLAFLVGYWLFLGSFLSQWTLAGLPWFFSFYQLSEPQTSPVLSIRQLSFGLIVASLTFVFAKMSLFDEASLLWALLAGNLLNRLVMERP